MTCRHSHALERLSRARRNLELNSTLSNRVLAGYFVQGAKRYTASAVQQVPDHLLLIPRLKVVCTN